MKPATGPDANPDPATNITVVTRSGFRFIVTDRDLDFAANRDLTNPAGFEAFCASGRSVPGGRGPNRLLESEDGKGALRIRPARHGGPFARALGERFLGPGRVLREFRLWKRLIDQGVPLAEPVFAGSRRRGLFWYSHLATRERSEAVDGLRWLGTRPDALTPAGEALARSLRRLHDAGSTHGDLHLRNLLFEADRNGQGVQCRLIDLDRARSQADVSPAKRTREWMRLLRSLEKSGYAPLVNPRLQARVLRAYCGEDRWLRREMLRAVPRELRRTARHRLGWKLSHRPQARAHPPR